MLNKKFIYLAGCAISFGLAAFPTFAMDPFIQHWVNFDGVKTYVLNINKSQTSGSYHIDYTFPGGNMATDLCNATSSNVITCNTGDILTRNDLTYSITVNSHGNTYIFYDPNHMPKADDVLGTWSTAVTYDNISSYYNITITRGTNASNYYVSTGFHDTQGNKCSGDVRNLFQMNKNPDGTELFSLHVGYDRFSFLYNPTTHHLSNPQPSNSFEISNCLRFSSGSDISFSKN